MQLISCRTTKLYLQLFIFHIYIYQILYIYIEPLLRSLEAQLGPIEVGRVRTFTEI